MSIRDNVRVLAKLPGPIPKGRWFVTTDLSESPDCMSEYVITEDGELHLIAHACAGLKERFRIQGLLPQYPDTPDINLGHQHSFTGSVELWSEVATYVAIIRHGKLIGITRDRDG